MEKCFLSFPMNKTSDDFFFLFPISLMVSCWFLGLLQEHQTPSHQSPLPSHLHQPSQILALLFPVVTQCLMHLLSQLRPHLVCLPMTLYCVQRYGNNFDGGHGWMVSLTSELESQFPISVSQLIQIHNLFSLGHQTALWPFDHLSWMKRVMHPF